MKNNSGYWHRDTKSMIFTTPLPPKCFLKYIYKDSKILDFGCGYGRLVTYLRNRGYYNYLGIDISKGLISRAKKTNPTCAFQVASLETLLKEKKKFDAVIILGVIENILGNTKRKKFAKEVFNILNNKGVVYLETFLLDKKIHGSNYLIAHSTHKPYGTLILKEGKLLLFHDTKNGIDTLFHNAGFVKKKSSVVKFSTWNDKHVNGYEVLYRKELTE